MNNILFDSHVHTNHSTDSNAFMEEYCKTGIEQKLLGFSITDHCECNDDAGHNYEKIASESFTQSKEMSLKYKDKILITKGVELGQAMQGLELAESVLKSYDYDFVLASLHNIEGYQDFFYIDLVENNIYYLLDKYFEQILYMVEWGKFNILGHLNYPIRYANGISKLNVDMTRYKNIIDKILSTLINNEKGIEINTSGLRQPVGTTLPDVSIIKRFYELGGKYITIGSDAHSCEDLSKGLVDAIKMLKEVGFKSYCYYLEQRPFFIAI